jgi:hypothetical protein
MTFIAQKPLASPQVEGVRLISWDPDLALGASQRMMFCIWRDRTTLQGVNMLSTVTQECTLGHKNDMAILTIVEPHAKMPEPGTREGLARLLKDLSGKVVISGLAYEGDGFMAASVRGIVIGLTALAHQPFAHRVFANVVEIAHWFESKQKEIGVLFPAERTIAEVSEFRRLLRVAVEDASARDHNRGSDTRLRTDH